MEAVNGYGTYDQFLLGVERLLVACEQHPDAKVRVLR